MSVQVFIQQLDSAKGLPLPSYATEGSAGFDLIASNSEDITIKPLERKLIPTGIKIALPAGFEAQVRPRSGLAFKNGITVLNTPGTIDSDYRGEIGVVLVNLSNEEFTVTRGMRIAQIIIAKHEIADFSVVNQLPESVRGEGGFGSTGTKIIEKVV